jgi:hypothetical protein
MNGKPIRVTGGPDFWVPHITGPVGCHCFGYDRRDPIAYVGMSEVSLQDRIGQHRRDDYW